MSTNILTDLLSGKQTQLRAAPLTIEDLGWPTSPMHWLKAFAFGTPAFGIGVAFSMLLGA